ncbi:hypothetical protein [Alkalihalobacillus alcalophilus]|nr:hypothetical protein [Alkalihalobacillus alcalophilus]
MTAEEILTKEPDADIFMFNEFIYQANIDWVDEMTLISGEKIGEITEQAVDGHYNYTNGMANKLSVGATIYEVEEDNANENGINEGTNFILIVNDNGEEKYYLASTEG